MSFAQKVWLSAITEMIGRTNDGLRPMTADFNPGNLPTMVQQNRDTPGVVHARLTDYMTMLNLREDLTALLPLVPAEVDDVPAALMAAHAFVTLEAPAEITAKVHELADDWKSRPIDADDAPSA
jgi:hypothetical protein